MRNKLSIGGGGPGGSKGISLSASMNVKSLVSPMNSKKKVEGFDRTASSQMFSSKVTQLKNKPKMEGLEEQYIGGLQDEIKYLEMELKLLQEKDQERHGQVDQLEKFFGDGIPINQNILAIKNGFNNYKTSNEQKTKGLAIEKQERSTLIDGLARKVEELTSDLDSAEKTSKQSTEKGQNHMFQLIFQEASLRRRLEKEDDQLKTIKLQNRKLFQKIEKVTRNKLIENITLIKHENNKHNKLNLVKDAVCEGEKEFLELEDEYSKMLKDEQNKGYLMKLEEQNLAQRRKAIILEREHDNFKSKLKEKEMELQEKLRERMVEITCKADIKAKVDQLKEEVNRENSLTVEAVNEVARGREIDKLKRIIDQNKKLSKYIDHYSNVLNNLENNIEVLAQRKPEAKSELQMYIMEVPKMVGRQQAEKEREISLHAEMVQTEEQSNQIRLTSTPVQEKTRKKNDQIQAYLEERRRLLEEIKVKEKQFELIFILKGLNFEELEMSKTSNNSIQEELSSFLKNWEKIQRKA